MSSNRNQLVAVRPYFSVNRRCPSINRLIRLIVLIQSAVWVRPDVRTPATGNTLMWVCHWDDNWKNLTPVHSKPSMWTAKIKKVWILRNWFHVKILTDGKMVKFSHCAGQTFVSLILLHLMAKCDFYLFGRSAQFAKIQSFPFTSLFLWYSTYIKGSRLIFYVFRVFPSTTLFCIRTLTDISKEYR